MKKTDACLNFYSHFLVFLAAWTLVIKFAFPAAMALNQSEPLLTYVMWDFWWVAHLFLAWQFAHWKSYTYLFALVTSVVEIAIIATKFTLFLRAPEWTIWRTNWFINKIFVLACFVGLLVFLVQERKALQKR
ncbi:MAG TPA: hypothetical protein VIH99_01475 [Bdellovibrionota bacterium]|jgi:hypothetical protein